MLMAKGRFEAAPLSALFPGASAGDRARIEQAAGAIDAARPDEPVWHWLMDHAEHPERSDSLLQVLCTGVLLNNAGSDWLELDLDIEWQPNGVQRAYAAVNVACWCEVDHNSHFLNEVSVDITDDVSVGEAVERSAGSLLAWIGGPVDPSAWRERAGLPQPPHS